MSGQSSQRLKKVLPSQQSPPAPAISTKQGVLSRESVPRETTTPSPSFREKQKAAAKAHVMSMYPQQPPIRQQPSPTSSNGSRRSPVPQRISPTALTKLSNHSTHDLRDRNEEVPDRRPSPPIHSITQPNMHHQLPPSVPLHSISQSSIHPGPNSHNAPHYPRPINRAPPPQFLTQYPSVEESWQMTDELMAEIERADIQQAQGQLSSPSGKSGVAYAGGAQSGPIALPKEISAQRTRAATERVSPKDLVENGVQNAAARKSHRNSQSSLPSTGSPHSRTPEHRRSPSYPLPGESSTQTYAHYEYEAFQSAQARIPTPSGLRNMETLGSSPSQSSTNSKFSNAHTPPLQSGKAKSPDRSLPVQEEPDDHHDDYDHRHRPSSSPLPSSDTYPEDSRPGYELKHAPSIRGGHDSGGSRHIDDDDSATLNEDLDDDDDSPVVKSEGRGDDSSGYTPRSPSVNLPEAGQPYHQQTIRGSRARVGPTDQLGMRGFYPQMFDAPVDKSRAPLPTVTTTTTTVSNSSVNRGSATSTQFKDQYSAVSQQSSFQHQPPHHQAHPQSHPQQQSQQSQQQQQQQPQQKSQPSQQQQPQSQKPSDRSHVFTQGYYPPYQMYPEDLQNFLDDPTSAYLHSYLQSPGIRPGAPIPPTPHSQTAAPSPSPLVSGVERPGPVGSPYPYPFSHVRRNAYAAGRPSSAAYDPNDPAVIREQLALQMQIYALNNAAMSSAESSFSPAATPFPGAGYNPWAFVPTIRGFPGGPTVVGGGLGIGRNDTTMSLRSSPSHEPVPLPPPPMIMKGLRKRERSLNLKAVQERMMNGGRIGRSKLAPPRVDSTQPRDTSPEMTYSGEETAGEEDLNQDGVEDGTKWLNGGERKSSEREVVVVSDDTKVPEVEDDEGDWIDEDEEDDDNSDLLDLAYHPTYVRDDQKRRRRWETKWEALVEAFRALDRQTDSTLVLLAAPPHTRKLHSMMSRSIRRDVSLHTSPSISSIRKSFNRLAIQQRTSATKQGISLVDRIALRSRADSLSADSGPGSETSSESREEDLRRALDAALGSLGALGNIYEQRELRWREEMQRLNTDRDSVELLLAQVFGQLKATNSEIQTKGTAQKERVTE